MDFNIIDNGNILSLATTLQKEGNTVNVYITTPYLRQNLYTGLVKPKPLFTLPQNTITINGLRGENRHFPQFKNQIGGNKVAERIELDREDGIKLAKTLGMRVPPYKVFTNKQAAITWLKQQKETYVIKLGRNYANYSTLVAHDNEQIIKFLNELPAHIPDVLLQKKIDGIEISTEAWFNSHGKIINLNHTIEQKGLLDNNKGPATGCACTDAVWNVPADYWEEDLIGRYLFRLISFIQKIHYVGPWDINCIIENRTGIPYFLEFTPGLGYSALWAWGETLLTDWSAMFDKVFQTTPIECQEDKIGYAVRIWLPPYPLELEDEKLAHQVFIKALRNAHLGKANNLLNNPHIHLMDVIKEKDSIQCAGIDGIIAEISDSCEMNRPNFGRWSRHLKDFEHTRLCYRQDVGSRFMRILPKLKDLSLI